MQNRNKSFTPLHLFYTETLIEKFKRWVFKIRTIGIISFLTVGVLIGILYSQLHHEYIWLATAAFTILAPILISVYMLKNLTNKSCGAKIFGLGLIGIIAIAAILIPDLFLSFEIEIYKYLPNIILPSVIALGVILLGSLFLKTHLPCIDSKHEVLSRDTKNLESEDPRVAKMACSKAFSAYMIYGGEDEEYYPKEAHIFNTAQRNHLS